MSAAPIDPLDFDAAILAMCGLCDAIKRIERIVTGATTRLDVEEVAAKREAAERTLLRIAERRSA